jgi:hypothetical protein
MKYLYVNGCSFTYGHRTEENFYTINKQRPNWTWSDHLSKHYDNMINEAWHGGSNHRIFRRALEFFQDKNASDWTAVIQWTNPDRYEYYDSLTDTYVGVHTDTPILDDRSWDKFTDNQILTDNFNVMLAAQTLTKHSNQRLRDSLMMSCVLAQYFTRRGIKFLFTNLCSKGHPRHFDMGEFQDIIDVDQYTVVPISQLVSDKLKENPPADSHPNKAGHYVIYKHILAELRQRGYL